MWLCDSQHTLDAGVRCTGTQQLQPRRIEDCDGVCVPATVLGDGWCDEGEFNAKMNCENLGCDGGDCAVGCAPAPVKCVSGKWGCDNGVCIPGATYLFFVLRPYTKQCVSMRAQATNDATTFLSVAAEIRATRGIVAMCFAARTVQAAFPTSGATMDGPTVATALTKLDSRNTTRPTTTSRRRIVEEYFRCATCTCRTVT